MRTQVLSLVAALLLPGVALAAAGQVSFLEGKATRTAAAGAKVALSVGSEVQAGDLIETRGGTRIEIALPDKSVVRLGPSSKLRLDQAAFSDSGRDFKATLMLGKVWSKVSKVFGSERNFEVRTERAVAGVRGTIFRLDASKNKAVLVKVYAGTVAVAGSSAPPPAVAGKGERVQIAGPQQVSRTQWEKIVGAMMQVKVGANGEPEEPTKFTDAEESKDAWAAWNKERDGERTE